MTAPREIDFTPEKARAFAELYQRADHEGKELFVFEGQEVLTAFAKYVVEYLEAQGLIARH